MKSFIDYAFNKEYHKVEKLGDKLAKIDGMIDLGAFYPIINDMYNNKSKNDGHQNIDEIVMIKSLVLQQWYRLSDPELERQNADKISFRKFLGFIETIPDYSTV